MVTDNILYQLRFVATTHFGTLKMNIVVLYVGTSVAVKVEGIRMDTYMVVMILHSL